MKSRYIQNMIMKILEDNRLHTMREMAEKIEVNISTIQRLLIDLSFCYQITTYEGRYGGVRLLPSADALTDEEIEYAVDALKEKSGEEKQVIIRKIRKLKKGIHNVGK